MKQFHTTNINNQYEEQQIKGTLTAAHMWPFYFLPSIIIKIQKNRLAKTESQGTREKLI